MQTKALIWITSIIASLPCYLHCMLNWLNRQQHDSAANFVLLMHEKTVCLHRRRTKKKKERNVSMYVQENTKHSRTCVLRGPLYFLYVSVSHGLPCAAERPGLQILHLPMRWGCYSCYCACLALCICVCQTPVLHPLLRLVSQLHTRREKGLVMHVCTSVLLHCLASQPLIDVGIILLCLWLYNQRCSSM